METATSISQWLTPGHSLFFQNAGAPGTFFPRITLGVHCNSVGIGDLNEDGRADLVCTGTDTGIVSILLQSPAGAGTFLPPETVAAGVQPFNVAIADLNADGLLDLAIAILALQTVHLRAASPSSLTIRPLREVFRLRPTTPRKLSCSVAVGDLNGDGRPDLAVANSGIRQHSRKCVSIFPESRHARSLSSRSESTRNE